MLAIQSWSIPHNLKVLREYLGLIRCYRKFIQNYGSINKPLTYLLKKNVFKWNSEATVAFEKLKEAMCSALILVLSDFTKPFTLETNVSGHGVGVVYCKVKDP
jgi:RNase H-like domain found in reverse transcriptase